MKAMKTNNTTLVFCTCLVLAAVYLVPVETKADNWIESGKDYWVNFDYTFVDRGTGFIVVEVGLDKHDGSYDYDLLAIDCDIWYFYVINEMTQSRNYVIFPDWRTDPDLFFDMPPGTKIEHLAKKVCPDRYTLPLGNIR